MDLIVAIRFVLDIPNSPLCSDSCARTAPDPPLPHLHRQCGQCAVCVCFLCCNHHRETWCSSSLNKLTRDQHIQHCVYRHPFLFKFCLTESFIATVVGCVALHGLAAFFPLSKNAATLSCAVSQVALPASRIRSSAATINACSSCKDYFLTKPSESQSRVSPGDHPQRQSRRAGHPPGAGENWERTLLSRGGEEGAVS
jgi:hypothetical protein